MKKYSIYIPWHCSYTVEVEAENKDEALQIAYKDRPSVCCHCSDNIQIEECNDECEPEIIEIE